MVFKKGIAYTGLCDVWGGKMWFCISPSGGNVYFWKKKECSSYIRRTYKGDTKAYLLKKLRERQGRAFSYA